MSSTGTLYNYPAPKETCECEFHALIHKSSGDSPPCKYDEQVELYVNSKGYSTASDTKEPEPAKIVVMEDNGFFIDKNPEAYKSIHDPHESWVGHYCPVLFWKTYLDEKAMMEYGVCIHCMTEVPPGLIALWKMHNWDYLQNSPPSCEVWDEAELKASCVA